MDQKPSADAEQRVAEIQKLHEKVRARIEKSNPAYAVQANKHRRQRVFQPGDLVWVHLRKECFPTKRKTKLMPQADGPFEILERINDNAYKVDLPGDYDVSATFNVADLSSYLDDNYLEDLRANSPSQGENNGGPSLSVMTSPVNSSPIACRGKLKEVLFQALGMHSNSEHHGQLVASSTGTRMAVRHPGCTPCRLPGFVLLVS